MFRAIEIALRRTIDAGSKRRAGRKVGRTVKAAAVIGVVLLALSLLVRILIPRFMICLPVALRMNAQIGCWVVASRNLGILPSGRAYWHIDRFGDRLSAEAVKGPNGTVVESYGKVWLLTVTSDASAPTPGEHVAVIGPLPTNPGKTYTAVYMEGTFWPGMKSIVHRHPGPEAFYNLDGEFCLETPGKKIVVRPGESVFVEEGTPMELTATGTAIRRSLVLILRSSDRMLGTPAFDWRSKGLCNERHGSSVAEPEGPVRVARDARAGDQPRTYSRRVPVAAGTDPSVAAELRDRVIGS